MLYQTETKQMQIDSSEICKQLTQIWFFLSSLLYFDSLSSAHKYVHHLEHRVNGDYNTFAWVALTPTRITKKQQKQLYS